MTNLLEKYVKFIYKNKNIIVILWLLSIIFSVYILSTSEHDNLESKIDGAYNTDAYNVENILKDDFKINQEASLALVIKNKDIGENLKSSIIDKFKQINSIIEINDNKKHNYLLYYVRFKPDYQPREAQLLVKDIREFISIYLNNKGLLINGEDNSKVVYVTGDCAFFYDNNTAGKKDSAKNEKIALFVSFLVLIYTFGGILSALLPLITGATTIIYLNILMIILNLENNPISQILNSLIGLGLAIDYSLFIISRYKEENVENDITVSLKNTINSSGKTIFFSALIMILSVSVLLIPDVTSSRTVVKSIIAVVFISCFTSLTFLPAFIIFSKNFLDKPLFLTNLIKKFDRYIFWKKFATHIVNYPKSYFILSVSILSILASPVLTMKLWEPMQSMTPKYSESIQGYELLKDDGWGGELLPVIIAVKNNKDNNVYSTDFISFLYNFTKEMEKLPQVNSVNSLTSWNQNFSKDDYINFYNSTYLLNIWGNNDLSKLVNSKADTTLVYVNPKNLMNIHEITEIINTSKNYSLSITDYKIYTGGVLARSKDFTKELYRQVPLMLVIIFSGIFIILYLYMKTPVLPIKASIMNFIPILSSFGILTLIFQYGYFKDILGTPHNGAISTMIPVTLFCIIFGLSMDYEILILSRITEHYHKTNNVKESVIEGIARSSHIITGAALILLGVFIPGIFSDSPPVKEICLGISAAIIIDATLVRLILVPSFMMIMGKWNWLNFHNTIK